MQLPPDVFFLLRFEQKVTNVSKSPMSFSLSASHHFPSSLDFFIKLAQTIEHGASNGKVMGLILRGSKN